MAPNSSPHTLTSSDHLVGKNRARRRRQVIVALVLVQIVAAAFLIANRSGSEGGLSSKERLTAEEALLRGTRAQSNGQEEEARQSYLQVLEIDPNNKVAHYNLGVLEEGKGPASRAEEHYLNALAIDSNFVPALYNLAILRDAAGRPQEAADIYRKIIELDPAMAKAHLNLGFLLINKLNDKAQGRTELIKAIILDESLGSRVSKEDLQS